VSSFALGGARLCAGREASGSLDRGPGRLPSFLRVETALRLFISQRDGRINRRGAAARLFQCVGPSFAAPQAELRNLLVSVEFLGAYVFLGDTGSEEHLAHASNHPGRAGNVVGRHA